MTRIQGSIVVLDCLTVVHAKQKWLFNSSRIYFNENHKLLTNGSLILRNVNGQHSGTYHCEVEDSLGADRISYNLLILLTPAPPVLRQDRVGAEVAWVSWSNNQWDLVSIWLCLEFERKE